MTSREWSHPTLSEDEFLDRLVEVTVAESAHPEQWWWCSFADGNLPKGEQFLGVAVVRARGLVGAALVARQLGINPGGEVQGFPIPDGKLKLVPEELRERLLSHDDLQAAGLL